MALPARSAASIASLAIVAFLVVAILGLVLEASSVSEAESPRIVKNTVTGMIEAEAHVKPLLLLGNKSILTLSEPNGSLLVPSLALGVLELKPVIHGDSMVDVAQGVVTMNVTLGVYGFHIPIATYHDDAAIDPQSLFALAEAAAKEAGLGRPSRIVIMVEASIPASARHGGDVKPLTLRPKLVVEKQGSIVTIQSVPDTVSLVFREGGERKERGLITLGSYLLAAGSIGMIASAIVYAYTRPRPPLPKKRLVEASLPENMYKVRVASLDVVKDIAEKLDYPILDTQDGYCVVDRGIAYCYQRGGDATPRGGGGEAQA